LQGKASGVDFEESWAPKLHGDNGRSMVRRSHPLRRPRISGHHGDGGY